MCCISCVAQSFGRSPRLASLWHLHSSMMMDAPDDGLCPWERDICDEELISLAEMQQQEADMAEAMAQEMAAAQTGSCDVPVTEPPTFGLEDSPAAVPCAAVVLPLSQQPSSSTQACSEEPTALTTQHILATSLPPVPKFRRLDTKTTVPESVCPVVPKPCLDLRSTVFTHSEEFGSQYFFRKLSGQQQYTWVYERLRAFYTNQVHPRILGKQRFEEFQRLTGKERQQEGRRAFKELDHSDRATVARAWRKASSPPCHIAHMIDSTFIHCKTGLMASVKAKGVLLTWMLPPTWFDVSSVMKDGEPTALADVVLRMRLSVDVQSIWQEFRDHAQACMRLSGAQDVAVCMEVCPETWEAQRDVRLHTHTFLKSSEAPLRARNLAAFEHKCVKPHMSFTIGGAPVTSNSKTSWAGFCLLLHRRQDRDLVQ